MKAPSAEISPAGPAAVKAAFDMTRRSWSSSSTIAVASVGPSSLGARSSDAPRRMAITESSHCVSDRCTTFTVQWRGAPTLESCSRLCFQILRGVRDAHQGDSDERIPCIRRLRTPLSSSDGWRPRLQVSCDALGQVDMDSLSERARLNYLYARAVRDLEVERPDVRPCRLN